MIRRWLRRRKRRATAVPEVDVESLMAELNEEALKRDFGIRRSREIHGMPAPEIASTRRAFEELIRGSWTDTHADD